MDKIKILFVPSDTMGGVGYYRSFQPHKYIAEKHPDEFEISYTTEINWSNLEELSQFDIIHLHKGLFGDMKAFYDALAYFKDKPTSIVIDIDDSWDLSETHPQYLSHKKFHIDDIIKNNLKFADWVTTTTPIFAQEIYPLNKHVKVFPNAINPNDPSFMINNKPYDKIRIGFVMGSAHEYDVATMGNFISQLSPEVIDKIQIVLCGYDLRGSVQMIHEDGKITERPIKPEETVWYRYEQMVTNNYKIVSPKYRRFLSMFVPNLDYPEVNNEHYKRCWTKDMNHYFSHFENVDILLAPLEVKHFNYVKSQLKAIECCFSDTALIAANYGPYTVDLKHALNEDGTFNENGNALLVDTDKNENWAKYIEYLVKNPEKIDILKKNIHKDLVDTYNLDKVCEDRADFYREIVKYSKR